MAAPAVLEYGGAAAKSARIVGPIVITFSITAIWEATRGVRLAVLPLAVWLVAAPWLLGYTSISATLSDIVVGITLLPLAFVGGEVEGRYGGGWRELLEPWSPDGA